ncbi:hypothetical protein DFH06DRAFT_619273 [Mycena polygramma]|nr:hypothetical protein DFH06DRAFT_619273 [Mycena polygramma]
MGLHPPSAHWPGYDTTTLRSPHLLHRPYPAHQRSKPRRHLRKRIHLLRQTQTKRCPYSKQTLLPRRRKLDSIVFSTPPCDTPAPGSARARTTAAFVTEGTAAARQRGRDCIAALFCGSLGVGRSIIRKYRPHPRSLSRTLTTPAPHLRAAARSRHPDGAPTSANTSTSTPEVREQEGSRFRAPGSLSAITMRAMEGTTAAGERARARIAALFARRGNDLSTTRKHLLRPRSSLPAAGFALAHTARPELHRRRLAHAARRVDHPQSHFRVRHVRRVRHIHRHIHRPPPLPRPQMHGQVRPRRASRACASGKGGLRRNVRGRQCLICDAAQGWGSECARQQRPRASARPQLGGRRRATPTPTTSTGTSIPASAPAAASTSTRAARARAGGVACGKDGAEGVEEDVSA